MRNIALALLILASSPAAAERWLIVDDLQGTIPKAPSLKSDSRDDELCKGDARQPLDAADEALTAAGWLLWGATERDGDFTIRIVAAGLGGQCRPVGISILVFAGGLPTSAFYPAESASNLTAQLKAGYLHISQTYPKPGEGLCCGTGKRAVSIRLAP